MRREEPEICVTSRAAAARAVLRICRPRYSEIRTSTGIRLQGCHWTDETVSPGVIVGRTLLKEQTSCVLCWHHSPSLQLLYSRWQMRFADKETQRGPSPAVVSR